jgi:hypothetical protein
VLLLQHRDHGELILGALGPSPHHALLPQLPELFVIKTYGAWSSAGYQLLIEFLVVVVLVLASFLKGTMGKDNFKNKEVCLLIRKLSFACISPIVAVGIWAF